MTSSLPERLLVTGGCGFIGANFIRHLLSRPDFTGDVVNVDTLTYAGNPASLRDLEETMPERYRFIRADIRDARAIGAILHENGIDGICHFAAESHVDRSIAGPDAFIQTNILGTYTLLKLALERGPEFRLFHHVSTDEVFGSLGPEGAFTETSPYRPNSPYSASKAASDHLVRAYSRTYGLPVTISNCSNNYGPYQFPEKLIPLMILNALEGRELPVYGDGAQVRDWLHVEDHCEAIYRILQSGERGATYVIGGRGERSNLEVVERICDLVDELAPQRKDHASRRDLIRFVRDRPGHDRRYAIDSSRIERDLGWTPQKTFDSGLRDTVSWYLENLDWVNAIRSGEYRRWIAEQYGDRD